MNEEADEKIIMKEEGEKKNDKTKLIPPFLLILILYLN